ncbi:hypothetical protein TNCV_4586151 [Trichonephila clavipes]|nr:hypothetical protein TNCV_4586151 [Trichonephila clavipes]
MCLSRAQTATSKCFCQFGIRSSTLGNRISSGTVILLVFTAHSLRLRLENQDVSCSVSQNANKIHHSSPPSGAKNINFCTVQPIAKLPTGSPKMTPTWLYHQHFAMLPLNRHYNVTNGIAYDYYYFNIK